MLRLYSTPVGLIVENDKRGYALAADLTLDRVFQSHAPLALLNDAIAKGRLVGTSASEWKLVGIADDASDGLHWLLCAERRAGAEQRNKRQPSHHRYGLAATTRHAVPPRIVCSGQISLLRAVRQGGAR